MTLVVKMNQKIATTTKNSYQKRSNLKSGNMKNIYTCINIKVKDHTALHW